MHTVTCRSFERTAGSSPCPPHLPWLGKAELASPPSSPSESICITGQWLCLLDLVSQTQVLWRLSRSQFLSCSLKKGLFFSLLENNGSAYTMSLIPISNQEAVLPAGPSRQCALTPSWAQHWEAGPASCSSKRTQCTTSKGESCSLLTSTAPACRPYPQPSCFRGSSSSRGSTGVEVGHPPLMVTPQVIPH